MLQQEVARCGQLIERTDIEREDIGCITTKIYKYQGNYYVELWENGRNIHFSELGARTVKLQQNSCTLLQKPL